MVLKKKVATFFSDKRLKLLVDSILLIGSGYLMLKKLSGFSISSWLSDNYFREGLVENIVAVAMVLVIAAIIFKVIGIYYDNFPHSSHAFVEPDDISDCLHRINAEIGEHLGKCEDGGINIPAVCEQHVFKVNLGLIVESMAEHIRKSISNVKIKKKDLFVSLYFFDAQNKNLEYVLHYDAKRDLVETKVIPLNDKRYEEYESVKCMNSASATAYVHNAKKEYKKGGSKRNRTIKHYLGCKVFSGERLYGFMNIEFHHSSVFSDEDEMQDFMEEHVYPFKLLLEYQFLKKDFFSSLRIYDEYWRKAS